jgi:hypothetical protein
VTSDDLILVLAALDSDEADPRRGHNTHAICEEVRSALRILGETGATHGLTKGIKLHLLAAQAEIDDLRGQLTTLAAALDDMRSQRDDAVGKIEDIAGSLERALAVIHGGRA